MTEQQTKQINLVRLVGTLDTQTVSRRDAAQLPGVITGNGRGERPRATLTRRFNEVQGTKQRAVLQVPSPFGKPFQIALHLEGAVEGRELLETSEPGPLLAADGELEWVQTTDPRYAVEATERGRRASELIFRVRAVRLASDEDEPGCDVWLESTVLTTSRVLRHSDRPVLIAVTTIRVNVERTRKGSRARISELANVAVAIPVDHPDAPNLLRQGNQVVIEGMLERYVVPLKGVEVDRAVAALDAAWATEGAGLNTPQARHGSKRGRVSMRGTLNGGGLLTELAYCEHCGRRMHHHSSTSKSGKRKGYYRCAGCDKLVCTATGVRVDKVDAQMREFAGLLTIPREWHDEVLNRAEGLVGHADTPSSPVRAHCWCRRRGEAASAQGQAGGACTCSCSWPDKAGAPRGRGAPGEPACIACCCAASRAARHPAKHLR